MKGALVRYLYTLPTVVQYIFSLSWLMGEFSQKWEASNCHFMSNAKWSFPTYILTLTVCSHIHSVSWFLLPIIKCCLILLANSTNLTQWASMWNKLILKPTFTTSTSSSMDMVMIASIIRMMVESSNISYNFEQSKLKQNKQKEKYTFDPSQTY